MMEKKKGFDLEGMFFVVNELNKSFTTPLPKGFERIGFCHFCLGANHPGNTEKKTQWCCGAWDDLLLPPLKICERFQVDKKRVTNATMKMRLSGKSTIAKYMHPIPEITFSIGGIVIKMPITK